MGLWDGIAVMNATTHMSRSPWLVAGDFNQITRLEQHSKYSFSVVDAGGIEDINIALQNSDLFEAQGKGLPFTWCNNQDDDPISKKLDHAFINQS